MSKSDMASIYLLVLALASGTFGGSMPADHTQQAKQVRDRYFRADHVTGARYLRLRVDGTYSLTAREHMGIFDTEAGRWTRSDVGLTFTPSRRKRSGHATPTPYVATEVTQGKHTFLAFDDDEHAPTLSIPVAETLQELKKSPETIPSYVFFEIDRATFDDETQKTYPFRTLRRSKRK